MAGDAIVKTEFFGGCFLSQPPFSKLTAAEFFVNQKSIT
jgi:hypothetical protein